MTATVNPHPLPLPPVAKKEPKVSTLHGETRIDDYHWLRRKEDPGVAAYLEAENAYTTAVMKPTEPLQELLYREMLARIKETDIDVPYRRGDWYYYSRTEQGRQYPIHCRRKGHLEAPEEVILDLNALAEGHSYMALGMSVASDDGNLLAFSTDNTGFRQYTLHVKDLCTGKLLPESIEKTGSVAWASDNATLFYTVEDAAKRQYRLYRHRLGAADDALVYEETDEAFNLGVSRTRSRKYLVLESSSLTTSDARILNADAPFSEWRLVAPRIHDQEYDVDHHGELLYIRTNDRGRNFRLACAPAQSPDREHWREVLPHRSDVMLESMHFFQDFYVLLERHNGLPQARVTDFRSGASHSIDFQEAAYSASAGTNLEFDSPLFRYNYQSLVTPSSVFDYQMELRQSRLLKQTEVLGEFEPSRYHIERLHASAADGTRIPISLVYRKDLCRVEGNPLYLYGYGSYGYPLPITFSSNRLSLLDRGVIFALAHIRGGGEMGKAWHDNGRMLNKRNSFTDFIAVADHLTANHFASPGRLIVEGGSAGGLLMGAVTNLRPDLFEAVVMKVPFVDVINTMLDETLPLTVGEFEEWGNPRNLGEYSYIRSYCPYSNLAAGEYPAMLVKTSFNDSQVMYWEPAKYVAKLRTLKTDARPLLLKTNMAAGHGGASGRYDALRETAFDYAFMLAQWGIAI